MLFAMKTLRNPDTMYLHKTMKTEETKQFQQTMVDKSKLNSGRSTIELWKSVLKGRNVNFTYYIDNETVEANRN